MSSIENNPILLSICIPTYNRANVLEQTLSIITSDEEFNEEVELIISDNCSTDTTREVVSAYAQRFKNIHYYCNDSNIKDRNFSKVLSYATGAYLKLQNDYLGFCPGALKYIKEKIQENRSDKKPIFFTGDRIYTRKKSSVIECSSLDEYVQAISTYVTFSSCFGAWREQFETLKDKDCYADLMLMQVDWTYRLITQEKEGQCIIYDDPIYRSSPVPLGVRKGYNFFHVHIENYYTIMKPYLDNGQISKKTYLSDRKYSLHRFSSKIFHIYIWPNKYFQFDTTNTRSVLWEYYQDVPLFYLFLLLYPFLLILKPVYYCSKQVLRLKTGYPHQKETKK